MWFFSRPTANAPKTRSKRNSGGAKRPNSARLGLEPLEDRTLLSTGWIATGSGQFLNNLTSIATDSVGDTYVAVMVESTATFGPNITLTGSYFGCVAKLDPNGNWLWATNLGNNAKPENGALAVDNSGNVYVMGQYGRFVDKLSSNGNLIWSIQTGANGYGEGGGLVLDSSGNIYIAGSFANTVSFVRNSTYQQGKL